MFDVYKKSLTVKRAMQLVFLLLVNPLIHLAHQRQTCILCTQRQFHRPLLGSCKHSYILNDQEFLLHVENYRCFPQRNWR